MEYVVAIASVPAIIAIVNFLKSFGVQGRWAMLAAVLVGVALNLANLYLGEESAYQAAVAGILTGLAASGLYDLRQG